MARPTLMGHRKFRRLCRLLMRPRYQCRGILELLWDSANESGEPALGDSLDVELTTEWDGDEGKLTDALAAAGFLERQFWPQEDGGTTEGYEIHNFWHHCPAYVRKRRQREMERRIKGERLVSDEPVTAVRRRNQVSGGRTAPNGSTPSPSPSPSPSPPDSSEPVADDSAEQPPVAIWIPIKAGKGKPPPGVQVRGSNGKAEAGITKEQVREHADSYGMKPAAVMSELKKARQWCKANPTKTKTSRGIMRFVNSWIDRAANTPRPGEPSRQPGKEYRKL